MPELWTLAASGAEDALFFEEAVTAARASRASMASIPRETGFRVAERLMTLGFAAEALAWLGNVRAEDEESRRLLAAQAHLALSDARAALAVLSGLGDPEAERLRAAAVLQLGDPAAAAEAWNRAGDADAGERARVWTRDWPALAEEGPEGWATAAALVASEEDQGVGASPAETADAPSDGDAAVLPAPAGPLARGSALVEESAAARAAIEGLLLSVATAPEE